jgi:hypothetical protein
MLNGYLFSPLSRALAMAWVTPHICPELHLAQSVIVAQRAETLCNTLVVDQLRSKVCWSGDHDFVFPFEIERSSRD